MADGTFAVLTLALGLWDMGVHHCPAAGCLAGRDVTGRTAVSIGQTLYQDEAYGEEIYLRRDAGRAFGPFQLTYGLSVTDTEDVWAGIGAAWTLGGERAGPYLQLHTMPGLYLRGDGVDLGGPVEFRSGVELGLQTRGGIRYGLSYDHRSNAELYDSNMGLETIQFRVSFPM